MDFTTVGSVNNYIKTLDMQNQWQRKKATGDFSTKEEKTTDQYQWLKDQIQQSKESESISAIYSKLLSGKKLTAEEKQYLQQKDPQAFQQAQQNENRQKRFEQELKHCKTKEDVQKLKMHHTAASLSTVNSVMNNPNITDDKKLTIVLGEQQKMSAMQNTITRFVKSGKYASLPTEAERAMAEKVLHEAEEAAREPAKDTQEKPAENTAANTGTAAEDAAAKPEAEAKAEAVVKAPAENAPAEKVSRAAAAEAKAALSPEVRKVKRARNSYMGHTPAAQETALPIKQNLDTTV